VIESAIADIEAPAIAADDPHTLIEEIAVVKLEFFDGFVFRGVDRFGELRDDLPGFFAVLDVGKVLVDQFFELRLDVFRGFGSLEDADDLEHLVIGGNSHAEAIFGVIFEEGVGPSRSFFVAFVVNGVSGVEPQ
jgi:hypothetical protein